MRPSCPAMAGIGSTLGTLGGLAVAPAALGPPSPVLARKIDPQTRDYASVSVGADPIDAQVQLAMSVIRNSGACVTDDGIPEPPRKMLNLQTLLDADARLALSRLVKNGDIRVVATGLNLDDEGSGTANFYVQYVNLRLPGSQVQSFTAAVPDSNEA